MTQKNGKIASYATENAHTRFVILRDGQRLKGDGGNSYEPHWDSIAAALVCLNAQARSSLCFFATRYNDPLHFRLRTAYFPYLTN